MASSSGMRASSSRSIKTCSNEFCGKRMAVSRPGWKSGDREVDLCCECLSVEKNSQIVMGSREEEIQDRPKEPKVKRVPLFQKVLTASDIGKSTWLVLPKNCAENFFPSINDEESKKVVCQDTEGEDWKFTLRLSPKYEGRMYVLDKFNLYAQDMDLSLGDTVTFSWSVPEGKFIIGYRKNSSESPSIHLPRAAIPSASRVRDTRGSVKFCNVNGAKGKKNLAKPSMVSHDDANESPNVGAQTPLSSDHGGNGACVTVSERVKIKRQKDKAETSTRKNISKGKDSLPTVATICNGKATNSTRVPPMMVPFAPPVRAKGKHIENGSTSGSADKKRKISAFDPTLKESTEVEWSPRAPRNGKGKAVVRSSSPPPKKAPSKNKSDAKKIKNITLTTIRESSSKRTKTRNREPEPQATVEARAAPKQSKVTKKHPRHRTGCQCIICIQLPIGSNHSSTCHCRACAVNRRRAKTIAEKASKKPSIRRQRKVPEPAEPSNGQTITVRRGSEEYQNEGRELSQSAKPSNEQNIRVNRDSEENRNDQSLTGSHSNNTIRPLFDLNLPPPDDDDDFVDPTHQYTNGYGG